MSIHLLTEQKAQDFTTGCGRSTRSKDMPPDMTGWSMEVTCPLCVTRLFVAHKRLENLVEMTKTIDLDDPTVAKKFHFSGKRFGFRWLIDGRVIYVYETPDGFSPMLALPIQNFVPDTHNRDCTYADAQSAARDWIIKHEDGFANPTAAHSKHKKAVIKSAPRKPKMPAGYDGPLCASCGKPDEGDFMPHPENMLAHLCMTCLVAGKK